MSNNPYNRELFDALWRLDFQSVPATLGKLPRPTLYRHQFTELFTRAMNLQNLELFNYLTPAKKPIDDAYCLHVQRYFYSTSKWAEYYTGPTFLDWVADNAQLYGNNSTFTQMSDYFLEEAARVGLLELPVDFKNKHQELVCGKLIHAAALCSNHALCKKLLELGANADGKGPITFKISKTYSFHSDAFAAKSKRSLTFSHTPLDICGHNSALCELFLSHGAAFDHQNAASRLLKIPASFDSNDLQNPTTDALLYHLEKAVSKIDPQWALAQLTDAKPWHPRVFTHLLAALNDPKLVCQWIGYKPQGIAAFLGLPDGRVAVPIARWIEDPGSTTLLTELLQKAQGPVLLRLIQWLVCFHQHRSGPAVRSHQPAFAADQLCARTVEHLTQQVPTELLFTAPAHQAVPTPAHLAQCAGPVSARAAFRALDTLLRQPHNMVSVVGVHPLSYHPINLNANYTDLIEEFAFCCTPQAFSAFTLGGSPIDELLVAPTLTELHYITQLARFCAWPLTPAVSVRLQHLAATQPELKEAAERAFSLLEAQTLDQAAVALPHVGIDSGEHIERKVLAL